MFGHENTGEKSMVLNKKRNQGKQELLATLKYNPIIQKWITALVTDYEWSVKSYGYYDSNRRYLLLSGDFVGAFFDGVTLKQLSISLPEKSVCLHYPKFGYYPIQDITLPSGIYLSQKDILEVLANVVTENMGNRLPQITSFSDPYADKFNDLFCMRVDYELQGVTLKNWFDY